MYKNCPKFREELVKLKNFFNEYKTILVNAQKIEDLQDVESVQISIDGQHWECLRVSKALLDEHYKEWILNSGLTLWDTKKAFEYDSDAQRMKINTINLSRLGIYYLPKRLTITGNLDMSQQSKHSLKDLPDDLVVEGKLIIWWRDPLIHKARFLPKGYVGEIVEDMSN